MTMIARQHRRDGWAVATLVLAIVTVIWMSAAGGGALALVFGWTMLLYGLALILWLLGASRIVRTRRWWGVAVTLPVMAYPLTIFGLLALACAKGNCL